MTNLDIMNTIAEEEANSNSGGQEGRAGAGRGGTAGRQLETGLSFASRRFDRGNKGYLDEVEKSARRLASKTGDVSIDDVIAMKEEQRAMSKKTSKLVKSNVFLIVLLIFGSVGLGLTIMNGKSTVCICYYYFL
jgi:L-aminopeptidase/D-esterase-like protein